MSKLLPDMKYMVTRKNKSYLHSLYIGVVCGTFYLPLAVLNGLIRPLIVRTKDLIIMYLNYVRAGIMGYADVLTHEEHEKNLARRDEAQMEVLNRLTASINQAAEQLDKDTK